jgi:Ca-activated chloride channel family protein
MERRTAIRNLMVAACALFLPRPFSPSPREDRQDLVIRSEVRLVLLDVRVKDREGRFVEGLSQSNFEVFENGIRQPTTVFAFSDLPVTVGILVDESRSMAPKRKEVLAAAGVFIAESNPMDEIFVLNFNETVKRGLPAGVTFSDNIEQLREALDRGVPLGRTALNDAVVEGLTQLGMGTRDKKTLIVISDGGDNASRHPRREMLEMLERSIATVYAIGLFDAGDPDNDPSILKQLARMSGGEAYFPADPSALAAMCRGIAKDIRTRYTIGYVPAARNGTGSLRHIRVNVSAPGFARLSARTRTSYRYDEIRDQGSK